MASNKSTTSSPVIAAPIHVAKGSDQGLSSLSATKADEALDQEERPPRASGR